MAYKTHLKQDLYFVHGGSYTSTSGVLYKAIRDDASPMLASTDAAGLIAA